jgi:hypothetical protein
MAVVDTEPGGISASGFVDQKLRTTSLVGVSSANKEAHFKWTEFLLSGKFTA